MKKQLLTLQQLIGIMDPELYRHFGECLLYVLPTSPHPISRKNRGPEFVFLLPVSDILRLKSLATDESMKLGPNCVQERISI